MSQSPVPADLVDLLERPLFGMLGTIRPNDTVQVNPMWFEYDGEHLRFTHTTYRQKYRNLAHNPAMSLLVVDPDDPMRFLECRGKLVEIVPDPTGAFYSRLDARYGSADPMTPPDAVDRIILVMSIERTQRK
ncbi:PPOX class F420-dependent oxidoreductase [Agromyces seonyuensis]|uniref:TIGR03618 family F420-dependent PPOX class oxidoreductase n=1 Tax=Agromyces seonyuensis TaxID=2662446 RepID=A0A6I4P0W2_9MICO|nr:PPOX class F420-dependent oxidoreductase [Agromyces seonyuensis]MWB99152.1 TIGR03618 family F420-dependent PPOX class oxidoreductase [Agromyces seonyuensis]